MTTETSDNNQEVNKLLLEIQKTNEYLRKYTSIKHVMLRGMMSGLAGFIGATVVIAIIIATLSKLSVVPILGDFIIQLLDFIQNTNNTLN